MFLVDDLLLSPFKGLLFLFRELHKAVQQEGLNEAENIRTMLGELYMMLETKRISEEEFDVKEKELLDRLEAIQSRAAGGNGETETDET
jgi:hypothetical protein